MEIRWTDDSSSVGYQVAYIDDSEQRWGTGSMAARVFEINGRWRGLYWAQGDITKQGSLPECSTREEARALATLLLRMES
jgi:hypothetical protein